MFKHLRTWVQLPAAPLDSPFAKFRARSWQATYREPFDFAHGKSSVPSFVEGQLSFKIMNCFVYMIEDQKRRRYIGVSQNPQQRLKDHNANIGAAFTKRGGFKLVFCEEHPDMSAARKREIQIKKWRREKKDWLIQQYLLGLSSLL
jgi:putative endonuclease